MIVDANVTVYWCIPCPYTGAATRIMSGPDLCAPSIVLVETAHALLKYVRAGMFGYGQLQDSAGMIRDAIDEFVPDEHLLERATDMAFTEGHPVYDCLYLALAQERREPLATADRRLAALAGKLSIETELIEPAS